jgi:hypothetical protein
MRAAKKKSKSNLSTNNKLLIRKAIDTQTHLDIWHSTLGYDLKFKHRNFRAFSIQNLAATSECPLVRAKFRHPQGPSNTNSKRRNQSIQLPLQCSHHNELIASLTEPPTHKRLRRYWHHDLLTRF